MEKSDFWHRTLNMEFVALWCPQGALRWLPNRASSPTPITQPCPNEGFRSFALCSRAKLCRGRVETTVLISRPAKTKIIKCEIIAEQCYVTAVAFPDFKFLRFRRLCNVDDFDVSDFVFSSAKIRRIFIVAVFFFFNF